MRRVAVRERCNGMRSVAVGEGGGVMLRVVYNLDPD